MSDHKLKLKFEELGVREEDIVESFTRSSGPGGQNVNKVETCVSLHHRPSGIRVKCQTERSQNLNRLKARQMLAEAIEEKEKKALAERVYQEEKERRQERRRSGKTKEAMLEKKRIHSEKKANRRTRKLSGDNDDF